MNPYQQELNWFGLYKGSTSADVLRPKVRKPRENAGQMAILDEDAAEDLTDPTVHPAKMSLPLLSKILDTLLEWGWLTPGSVVIDPFGGVGSTALVWCAANPENVAVTIELEPHFVEIQRQTKAYAERKLGRPLRWTILQGDSRTADRLLEAQGALVLTSAPYGDQRVVNLAPNQSHSRSSESDIPRGYGDTPGQIGNLSDAESCAITSAPYGNGVIGSGAEQAERLKQLCDQPGSSLAGRNPQGAWFQALASGYGQTPGNIDLLPDGDAVAVTSAPYLAAPQPLRSGEVQSGEVASALSRTYDASNHGDTPGQIGNLPLVACGSAPYEAQSGGHPLPKTGPLSDPRLHARHAASKINAATGYAENQDGQIGATQGENYADAVTAVYAAMARAGVRYLVSVTKNPTRGLKGIKFCKCKTSDEDPLNQSRTVILLGNRYEVCPCCGLPKEPETGRSVIHRLDRTTLRALKAAGYRVVAWRRAWLFHTEAQFQALNQQSALFDGGKSKRVRGRVSFFKRLSMKKGAPAAAWEDIYFCELVAAAHEGALVLTSAPYGDALGHPSLGSVRNDEWGTDGTDIVARRGLTGEYGTTEGQIGTLPDEELSTKEKREGGTS